MTPSPLTGPTEAPCRPRKLFPKSTKRSSAAGGTALTRRRRVTRRRAWDGGLHRLLPQSELRIFEGAGHQFHSEQFEAVADAVIAFVIGVEEGRQAATQRTR